MTDFNWAVNKAKLGRAVKEVTATGKPVTEGAVKEVYVRLAGLVVEPAVEEAVVEKKVEQKVEKKGK